VSTGKPVILGLTLAVARNGENKLPAAFFDAKPFSRNKAIVFVFISAVLWSTNGLFIKLIDLGPLTIVGVRSAIAAIMMIVLFNKNLRFNLSFPQLAGAVAYSATVILFVTATKMTTAANVVFLHYTAPVFTALLGAWLLREKVSRLDWLIMAVVLGGMALLFLDEFTPGGLWAIFWL
jgi:drug/metabolite transporter (DMT)-like permease